MNIPRELSSTTTDPRPGQNPGYPEEQPEDKEDAQKSGPDEDQDRDEGGMDREPEPDGDSAAK